MSIVIPNPKDGCVLRYIDIEGYKLLLWDLFRRDKHGKDILGYAFYDKNDKVLFVGEDYYCTPSDAIDSDKCVRSLLCFLTLRPGDTDWDYFRNYSRAQMNFAQSDAEHLSIYADDESTYEFKDIE